MYLAYQRICVLIISFFIYAVAGWVWESLVCPLLTNHPIHNSGFLNGPIVPIYGAGALAVSLLFTPDEKVYSIFLEGAVVACTIEYMTSYVMEKIYHRRWWDYSYMKFNLNGRVCLLGFLVFGLFSVVCVKVVQPDLSVKIFDLGLIKNIIYATILSTLLAVDFGVTVVQMAHLQERMEMIRADLLTLKGTIDQHRLSPDELYELLKDNKAKEILSYIKTYESRIIKAFPQLLNEVNQRLPKERP